ncbi:MAG: epimerase [Bacteroidia bacterium]|nr:epimerase [Bacteroidia bacterium]
MQNLKVIITGSTGMVGEGVLLECLDNPNVESILVINRKTCGVTHPKLTEVLHPDFFDISPLTELITGYDACFFCLGVSSVGMKEPEYFRLTYTLTMNFAAMLAGLNPGMTFCYVSGAGTDSTEKGRMMWGRIKGKTENDLMKLPFKQAFNFRLAFPIPTKGMKHIHAWFSYMGWLMPVLRILFPNMICSLQDLGRAMINSAINGYPKGVLEVKDIKQLAR